MRVILQELMTQQCMGQSYPEGKKSEPRSQALTVLVSLVGASVQLLGQLSPNVYTAVTDL